MIYYHVDVFTDKSLSGNGLTVFLVEKELSKERMQLIAQEFKQFETIFIQCKSKKLFTARIFTVEEELDFAGHPILGAAAVVHNIYFDTEETAEFTFELSKKSVKVSSRKEKSHYICEMNQGQAEFLGELPKEAYEDYLKPLNLEIGNLSNTLIPEVVSTGLEYLLVPIKKGLDKVRIVTSDYEELLAKIGAKFVYIFDEHKLEGRTWDNLGKVEDVATGSAAGPLGAYLYKHGVNAPSDTIELHQGSFVGRPSIILISHDEESDEIHIMGAVKILIQAKADF